MVVSGLGRSEVQVERLGAKTLSLSDLTGRGQGVKALHFAPDLDRVARRVQSLGHLLRGEPLFAVYHNHGSYPPVKNS